VGPNDPRADFRCRERDSFMDINDADERIFRNDE